MTTYWPKFNPLLAGYELKICRIYNYDQATNTVHGRLVEKFHHKTWTDGSGVTRSGVMHDYGVYVYYINIRMTTDEYYYSRRNMTDEEKLADLRDQNHNGWTMFLPNFTPEGIYNPIYAYVLMKTAATPGTEYSYVIGMFRQNEIPLNMTPEWGTCSPWQWSQRLFPTYKLYLLIPYWDFESGEVTNYYWNLDTQSLQYSVLASEDKTTYIRVDVPNAGGLPRDSLYYFRTYEEYETMFFKVSTPKEQRWPPYDDDNDGEQAYQAWTPDGFGHTKYYDKVTVIGGGGVTGGFDDWPLHTYIPESVGSPEKISVSFFKNTWDTDTKYFGQPSFNCTCGLDCFYAIGRTVHNGRGGILGGEDAYTTRGFVKDTSVDTALTNFINGLAANNVVINDKIKWPIQDMCLILKPYGVNGAAFGDSYTHTIQEVI